jgi:cytoskeletal protein RodZ
VGQFGEKFRNAREAKNLSLDDVSNVTKIGSRMLSAIEQERFDQLPGGVFNKGFIRAYAKHLGLNDADLITEYLACLRQAQIDVQTSQYDQAPVPENRPVTPLKPAANPGPAAPPKPASAAPKVQPVASPPPSVKEELPDLQLPRAEHVRPPRRDYSERRGSGIPWQLLAAALAVVLIAVLWRNHAHSASSLPATAAAAPAATEAPTNSKGTVSNISNSTSANSTSATATPVQPAPGTAAISQPASEASSSANLSQNAPDSRPPANSDPATSASPPPNPAKAATAKDNAAPVKTIVINDDSVARPAAKPAAKAAAAKPTLALVIRASENCFISVTADGQPVTQENLIAPAHTSVRAYHEISVRVGNAAAISFLWNGAEIPPQGAEAEAKTFVFDNEGMRVLSSQ